MDAGDGRTHDLGDGVIAVVAGNPGPLTLDGTRTYVVGGSRPVVLDPGPLDAAHLGRVETALAGRSPVAVCLTHAHADHAESAAAASERWGAPIRASGGTLDRLGLEGGALGDGETVEDVEDEGGPLVALSTPGHSGDHLCYFRATARDLFTGDLVLGEGSSMVAHPDGSVSAYLASLERLARLDPARLLPGHGPPVEEAVARLEDYAEHRLTRTEQVRQALADGVRSLPDLRAAVYGELPAGVRRAADLSLLAHLEHLSELGLKVPPLAPGDAADS